MNWLRRLRHHFKRLAFAFRLRRDGSFRYFGTRLYFPRGSHLVRRTVSEGIYEKAQLDVLSAAARTGTTVVDVGANIGLVSVPLLSRCAGIRVWSFEPSPRIFEKLARTCRESPHRDRWDVHSLCLADREGRQEFFVPGDGEDAFAGLVRTGRAAGGERITVACTTLDQVWSQRGRPGISVIKIDVEGAELRVLAGARHCVEACRPVVLTEWNGTNLAAAGEDPAGLLRYCREAGYRLHPLPGLFEIRSPEILGSVMREVESFLLLPD